MGFTRITVADDDPLALAFFCDALAAPGRVVEGVSSGAELAERVRTRAPADLIVTDVSMPWMNGLQLVEAARAAGVETPFVVVTGLERPDLAERARRLEKVAFLQKPVGAHRLRACVEALLSKPQAAGR